MALEGFRFLWAGVAFRRVYTIVLCFLKSRCNRQKNASRKSVLDRGRVRRNHRSGPARAAAIPTQTKLFMAITLSRCDRKTEDNSRDAIQNLGATAPTSLGDRALRHHPPSTFSRPSRGGGKARGRAWGSSGSTRPGSPHDGSISIGVTLKTFTPLRDRLGNRRERRGGLFDHLTVVADDAPPPVWVTGSRDSKHVHLDDLDAQDNSSARM